MIAQILATIAIISFAAGFIARQFGSPFPNIYETGDYVAGFMVIVFVLSLPAALVAWVWGL